MSERNTEAHRKECLVHIQRQAETVGYLENGVDAVVQIGVVVVEQSTCVGGYDCIELVSALEEIQTECVTCFESKQTVATELSCGQADVALVEDCVKAENEVLWDFGEFSRYASDRQAQFEGTVRWLLDGVLVHRVAELLGRSVSCVSGRHGKEDEGDEDGDELFHNVLGVIGFNLKFCPADDDGLDVLDLVARPPQGFSGVHGFHPTARELHESDRRIGVEDTQGDEGSTVTLGVAPQDNAVVVAEIALDDGHRLDGRVLVVLLDEGFDFLFHNCVFWFHCLLCKRCARTVTTTGNLRLFRRTPDWGLLPEPASVPAPECLLLLRWC